MYIHVIAFTNPLLARFHMGPFYSVVLALYFSSHLNFFFLDAGIKGDLKG